MLRHPHYYALPSADLWRLCQALTKVDQLAITLPELDLLMKDSGRVATYKYYLVRDLLTVAIEVLTLNRNRWHPFRASRSFASLIGLLCPSVVANSYRTHRHSSILKNSTRE